MLHVIIVQERNPSLKFIKAGKKRSHAVAEAEAADDEPVAVARPDKVLGAPDKVLPPDDAVGNDHPSTSIAPLDTEPVAVLKLALAVAVALAAEPEALLPEPSVAFGEAAASKAEAAVGEMVLVASIVAGAAATTSPKVSGMESMKARVGPARMLELNCSF